MAHLGSRGSKEKWKYEEGGKHKQATACDSRKRPNGAVVCALLQGEGLWGGEGGPPTNDFPPLGGRVCAGGLLLGISGWAAELVQHGLIPEGRAEEEGQRLAWIGWARHSSLTPRPFCSREGSAARMLCHRGPIQTPPPAGSAPDFLPRELFLLLHPCPLSRLLRCINHLFPLSFIIIRVFCNPVPH